MRKVVAVAFIAALSACASAGLQRAQTYEMSDSPLKAQRWASADVRELAVGNKVFAMWLHPTDRTVLMERRSIAGVGVALAEGSGMAGSIADGPEPQWRAGADHILAPLGCHVTDIYPLSSPYWEATYSCADSRQIGREEVARHRDAWRARAEIAWP